MLEIRRELELDVEVPVVDGANLHLQPSAQYGAVRGPESGHGAWHSPPFIWMRLAKLCRPAQLMNSHLTPKVWAFLGYGNPGTYVSRAFCALRMSQKAVKPTI